jgi:hypothetical protein
MPQVLRGHAEALGISSRRRGPARLLPLRPELRHQLRLLQWCSPHLGRQRLCDRPKRLGVHLSDSLKARHFLVSNGGYQ